MYAVMIYIQTQRESGERKEKMLGGFAVGFVYKIVTPDNNKFV